MSPHKLSDIESCGLRAPWPTRLRPSDVLVFARPSPTVRDKRLPTATLPPEAIPMCYTSKQQITRGGTWPETHTHDPQTDEDWTIHSINIHGTFFQRWCESVVQNAHPWILKATEFPVAYPPLTSRLPSNESALDIMAELTVDDRVLTLLIPTAVDTSRYTCNAAWSGRRHPALSPRR